MLNLKSKILNLKLLFTGYFLIILGLFLYSFTQIDLNLTLSRISVWQTAQKAFQQIGYFNRPLSTLLYLIIIFLLFIFYLLFLYFSRIKKVTVKQVWFLIIISSVILAFSYNAFSYDLFNYIFDAKIITHYHQNPYLQKALDYPFDPMLNFMRWTHRTYPYGPAWLALTVPLSYLGMNYFLPTFFLFKFLATASFLGTAYFTARILRKISPENETYGLVFFALNPIVLIESLVSAHNDIVMMFFAVIAIYLILEKKWIPSVALIIFSYLIKQVTVVLILPVFIYAFSFKVSKKLSLSIDNFFRLCITVSLVTLVYVLFQKEMQPWYFLWVLPFIAFLKPYRHITALVSGVSLGLLLIYVPFLYRGDWNGNALLIKSYVMILTPVIFLLGSVILCVIKKQLSVFK